MTTNDDYHLFQEAMDKGRQAFLGYNLDEGSSLVAANHHHPVSKKPG